MFSISKIYRARELLKKNIISLSKKMIELVIYDAVKVTYQTSQYATSSIPVHQGAIDMQKALISLNEYIL